VINGTPLAGKVVPGHEGTGVVVKVGADVNRGAPATAIARSDRE
jgi:D-arabinose 1-dehydrogenase-like Zn-dependent alcohol dehydrogenase